MSVRKFVAGIPVLGPVARRSYRILADTLLWGGSGPKSPKTVVNRLDGDVGLLEPREAFSGNSCFCSAGIAQVLESAISDIAEELPVIIFPSDAGNELHIGLSESDLPRFTTKLGAVLGQDLQWNSISLDMSEAEEGDGSSEDPQEDAEEDNEDTPPPLTPFQKMLRRERRHDMRLQWPNGLTCNLKATIFFPAGDKTDSRDSTNRFLRHIHRSLRSVLETPGIHPSTRILGGDPPEVNRLRIDVVYTWVNDRDPDWRKMYTGARGPSKNHGGEDAQSLSRFTSRDELRYSIRSVMRYLPWVGTIHVFSNCKPPDWFEASDRLRWVMHEDVIPDRYLPTFNSHAIEACLHLLPDLSEHFLYFNDDFFVNQSLPKSFFFTASGLTVANLEDYGVVNGETREGDKDYLNAARNGAALMRKVFGTVPTRLHKHAPYPLRVSVMKQLEERFPEAFEVTRKAHFREASDYSFASFLHHHFACQTGAGILQGYRSQIVKNTSAHYRRDLRRLEKGVRVRTFCINDGEDSHEDADWNEAVLEFLRRRYPLPHALERPVPEIEFSEPPEETTESRTFNGPPGGPE